MNTIIKIIIYGILIYSTSNAFSDPSTKTNNVVKIGVLAIRGPDIALARWQATADYLSESIKDKIFEIIPYTLKETPIAVNNKDIDFILTNTGNYVELEYYFGVSRLATLKTYRKNTAHTQFGAVIFTKNGGDDISSLNDLKGKTFAAVSKDAFGGFQMAWHEFKLLGIDPFTDFKRLMFVGLPHDEIVYSVINGNADAGTVRSEVIERLIDEKKIKSDDLRILNKKNMLNYPFPVSTKLYPEWPIAKLKNTDDKLAQKVAVALLTLDENSKAAVLSDTAGWTIPLNYNNVYSLFQDLKIGPYAKKGFPSVREILSKYWHILTMSLLILMSFVISTVWISRSNSRLVNSQNILEKEVIERIRFQNELLEYKSGLEKKINERTRELATLNTQLSKSENILRKLYEILSSTDKSFEDKIKSILQIGCEFLDLSVGVFSCFDDDSNYNIKYHFPENNTYSCTQRKISAGAYTELWKTNNIFTSIGNSKKNHKGTLGEVFHWNVYLTVPVNMFDEMVGMLEFGSQEGQRKDFNLVELDIVMLMSQWVASDLERNKAQEKIDLHQLQLSHVTRVNTMGEMASGLAHELNQPLTAIINYTNGCIHRINNGPVDSCKLMPAIKSACNEAERAAEIIHRLWELVRKGAIKVELVNIENLIQVVLKLLNATIEKHNIQIEITADSPLPDIMIDKIQIEQVVLNLLVNAVESLALIKDKPKLITILCSSTLDEITVCISDNGDGILEGMKKTLFEAFSTTKDEGLGMGLSISRSIIDKHGGNLHVKSNSFNNGAKFCFTLPILKR